MNECLKIVRDLVFLRDPGIRNFPLSTIPQGTILPNHFISVLQLIASPCDVISLSALIPIAHILLSPIQTPKNIQNF